MPASQSSVPRQHEGSSRVGQLMFLPVARAPVLVGSSYIRPRSGCTPGGSRYLRQQLPFHPPPVPVTRGPDSVSQFALRPGPVPFTAYTPLVTVCSWNTNGITAWGMDGIMVWAWMLWSPYALGHERDYGLGMDGIMVRACVLWLLYAVGTRTGLRLGHGCSGHRVLLEDERD